jgi:hypothetical protein
VGAVTIQQAKKGVGPQKNKLKLDKYLYFAI